MSKSKPLIDSDLPNLNPVGENGIDFIPKFGLREAGKSTKRLGLGENQNSPILTKLNELAKEVPSFPYSALVLRDNTIYIAQSSGKEGQEVPKIDPEKLKEKPAFQKLLTELNVQELKIEIKRYRPTGNHPDAIAIAEPIKMLTEHEFGEMNDELSKSMYLGLAAFNDKLTLIGQDPASCAACTAIIKTLNANGYNISVKFHTPTNFPGDKDYKIPDFIKNNPKYLDSYCQYLEKSLQELKEIIKDESNLNKIYLQSKIHEIEKDNTLSKDNKDKKIEEVKEEINILLKNQDPVTMVEIKMFKNTTLNKFAIDVSKAQEEIVSLKQSNIEMLKQQAVAHNIISDLGNEITGYKNLEKNAKEIIPSFDMFLQRVSNIDEHNTINEKIKHLLKDQVKKEYDKSIEEGVGNKKQAENLSNAIKDNEQEINNLRKSRKELQSKIFKNYSQIEASTNKLEELYKKNFKASLTISNNHSIIKDNNNAIQTKNEEMKHMKPGSANQRRAQGAIDERSESNNTLKASNTEFENKKNELTAEIEKEEKNLSNIFKPINEQYKKKENAINENIAKITNNKISSLSKLMEVTNSAMQASKEAKKQYYEGHYIAVRKIIENYSASLNLANINNNSISSGITATTGNQHLTHTEKENLTNLILQEELNGNGKYNLNDRLAAVNDNRALLNKFDREAVITANIDFKVIDAKKSAETEKTGSVEIRPEHNHSTDHGNNNQALIAEIQAGTIDKNTVIAIERKQYGENLGMKDVIKIANILEHNEKNPDNPLKLPEELENAPIFQDALLYKVAKEKGIKVISLEGGNLEHTKDSALYNENREQYMTDVISEVRSKGYNVIASVGTNHVTNLEKALESRQKHDTGVSHIPRKFTQKALNSSKPVPAGMISMKGVKKDNNTSWQDLLTSQSTKKTQVGRN
ncbi:MULTISPECIES: hypothetical protein [unclassified Rickettsia]|uniref:hypothetical protein n=1 Tax=unclassified Rickettsia TaxID=114295 RepID=UPI003132C713